MKIYTKTGDKGTSGLYNGERRYKEDEIFEALGTADELTSNVGLAMEFVRDTEFGVELTERLIKIQRLLQDASSNIATPRSKSNEVKIARTTFDEEGVFVAEIESWIDEYDEDLPKIFKFILPSGGKASASLHVARSVCRRAERKVHPLIREGICDESVGIFFNRLSDFLFNAARWIAHKEGKEEIEYKKP